MDRSQQCDTGRDARRTAPTTPDRKPRGAGSREGPARLATLLLAALAALAGCEEQATGSAFAVGGDPERGKRAIESYDCGVCHRIPGIRGANGTIGPPLGSMRRQVYIAGVVPNTPEHLTRWLMAPRTVDPRTAMPDLGVGEDDARDIAAYLYRAGG